MIVTIKLMPGFHVLENVTLVNNALATKMRRLKKRHGPWPTARLMSVTSTEVTYEVFE